MRAQSDVTTKLFSVKGEMIILAVCLSSFIEIRQSIQKLTSANILVHSQDYSNSCFFAERDRRSRLADRQSLLQSQMKSPLAAHG